MFGCRDVKNHVVSRIYSINDSAIPHIARANIFLSLVFCDCDSVFFSANRNKKIDERNHFQLNVSLYFFFVFSLYGSFLFILDFVHSIRYLEIGRRCTTNYVALAIVKVRFYFVEDLNVMPRLLRSRVFACVCVFEYGVQYHHMILWLVLLPSGHRFHAFKSFPISVLSLSVSLSVCVCVEASLALFETTSATMFRRGDKLANSNQTHIVCDGLQQQLNAVAATTSRRR